MAHSDESEGFFTRFLTKKTNSPLPKLKLLMEYHNISQNILQFSTFSMRNCISDFSTETLSQEEINCHNQSMEKLLNLAYKI
jgi:hypothetical protein